MSNLKVALYLLAIPIIAIATGFTMTVLTDIGNRKMNEHIYITMPRHNVHANKTIGDL